MANRSYRKRLMSASELTLGALLATTGAWTSQLTGNVYTFHKAAAATNSVINFPVPSAQKAGDEEDGPLSTLKLFYQVTTADLTTAPACALRKLTHNTTTGAVTSATVTQAITFGGIDAVGKVSGAGAAGSHIAIVTVTTPTALADNEALIAEFTMGEAATSVLDISGAEFSYN